MIAGSLIHLDLPVEDKKKNNDGPILDRILLHVGEMGTYQKLLFVSMFPIGLFTAFVCFVQMFVTATPQRHWCHVPELAILDDMELRRNLSAPGAALGDSWQRCATFVTNWSQVLMTMTPPAPGTPMEPCKHGWEFELVDIPYHTVVSERGWVCENARLVPSAQSIFFVGSLVGVMLFGRVADRFGRVPALVGSNLIGCIGGVASTFTTGFWDFAFCRFLVGMSYDAVFMMLYILVLEYVGPKHRTMVANMSLGIFFGGGCALLPWLSLGVADWRTLLWVTSVPMLVVLVAPFVLPESASWLASQGHSQEAVKVLKRFERVNRRKIPKELIQKFLASSSRKHQTSDESFTAVLKSVPLRLVFIFSIITYMACSLTFDGLVRMSESVGLDFFITFTLTSITEIPSVILLTLILDRWGRRALTCGSMSISGILAVIAAFSPKGVPLALLAIISRFFINMSACALNQWTAEVLPTPVRATACALVHMSGFAATLLSPHIVFLERVWSPLPMMIFGSVSIMAAAIGVMLPETKGLPMPQTIVDGEKLYRENSILGKRNQKNLPSQLKHNNSKYELVQQPNINAGDAP